MDRKQGDYVRLLVVDDEPVFRKIVAIFLRKAGFEVALAESADDALRVARENQDCLHLAVVDVIMPGMHGDQLVGHLRSLAPALPVILMSGHPLEPLPDGRTWFIEKPFSCEKLLSLVSGAVGDARGDSDRLCVGF